MECNEDLISKYQILLRNEKKRLTDFDLKENASNSNNNNNRWEHTAEKCDNEDINNSYAESSLPDNKSSQVSELFNKQIVPTDCSYELRETVSPKILTKNMEQWVTDSFYTSFPSYKNQNLSTKKLADDRRQDYKKYLAEVSNKKLLNVTKINREQIDSKASKKEIFSTRNKLLEDLKHSDIADNFLSPDAIHERNQKFAIERTRKKVELQQELIRQIEEKKREFEKLRAKEKEEDETLSRKLEMQVKALQLDEELRKKKVAAEKVPLTNPINNSNTTHIVPEVDNETEKYKSVATERKSYSENGKKTIKENNDRQLYKFFSNSAPHNDYSANYNEGPIGFNNMFSRNNEALHQLNQQCGHCRSLVPMLCSSCCPNHLNHHYCCSGNNLLTNMDVCNNCRLAWIQSWHHNRDVACEHGGLKRDVNRYKKQPQILEITYKEYDQQLPPLYNGGVNQSTNTDSPLLTPVVNVNRINYQVRNDSNSLKTNTFDESELSVRPASTDDELSELKRKNEILIAKYAKNYGSLRKRRQTSMKKEINFENIDDSFPLPLMREHFTTAEPKVKDKDKTGESQAVRKLGYKWEIPVVQKHVIDRPTKVLTQVGAIAKQLQLEKLNFSDN